MTRSGSRPPLRWVALLCLAALVVLERAHTYAEPPERDIAGYAVIGHEMLRGRHLYADLWERKPPLLYATFAAAEKAVGYGLGEVFAVNILAAMAMLGGCYAAGRAVGGTAGGLVAAVLWALVGGDLWLAANQPNAEVFVNAALTAAVAALVRPGPAGWRRGLAVGGLFTIATLYEQHAVVTCATLAAGYVAAGEPRVRAAAMAVAAGVGAIAWAGLAGYFAAVGRLPVATDVLFHQLFSHTSVGGNLAAGLAPVNLIPSFLFTWAVLPMTLVLLAAVAGRRAVGSADRPWLVWAGWAVGTWVFVALPGRFFPHYYQCWIPPMCVAGGWAAGRLLGPVRRWYDGRAIAVAAVVGLLAFRQLPQYGLPPERWAALKYPDDNFPEEARLARRLSALLRPDETFWVYGQDNSLYFLTGRSPVSGQLFLEPLNDQPTRAGWDRLQSQLEAARPPLLLVRDFWAKDLTPTSPLVPWMRANYVPVATGLDAPTYRFWVRRGDADLAGRLLHPPATPVTGTAP